MIIYIFRTMEEGMTVFCYNGMCKCDWVGFGIIVTIDCWEEKSFSIGL